MVSRCHIWVLPTHAAPTSHVHQLNSCKHKLTPPPHLQLLAFSLSACISCPLSMAHPARSRMSPCQCVALSLYLLDHVLLQIHLPSKHRHLSASLSCHCFFAHVLLQMHLPSKRHLHVHVPQITCPCRPAAVPMSPCVFPPVPVFHQHNFLALASDLSFQCCAHPKTVPITVSVFNATPAVQHLTSRVLHVSACLCHSCFIAHLLSRMHLPSKRPLHICVHFYSRCSQHNLFQATCSALESKHPSHHLHSNLCALIALAYTAVCSSDKGVTWNRRICIVPMSS